MSEFSRYHTARITLLLVIAATCLTSSPVFASDATQQLQSAVHRLTARLNADDSSTGTSEGWRRYLMLNVLETQAAKGEQADIATLFSLHQRFVSGAVGLDHPVFSEVRVALENQIQNLQTSNVGELGQAVVNAASQFQPITVAMIVDYRNRAWQELESLKVFYRAELPSFDRADAFYTLQLDEAADFLNDIEIELAPEISVGKLNSMVRDVQVDLDKVIEKIDSLPFRSAAPPQLDDDPIRLDAPEPDDNSDLADLKARRMTLEGRIDELKNQRREIGKQDALRSRARIANLRKLFAFESGFADTAEDFGDPYFVSARLAFVRFVRAYYFGTEDNLQEDYLQRIERLSEVLPKLNDPTDRLSAGIVGVTLDWLENAFQAPSIVTAIRAKYSLPNAYVMVSGNFLNRQAGQSLSETRPIYETIKGRLIRGTASNSGSVSFDLVDDPNQVHVSIRAYSDVTSNTFLEQGKIKAYINASGPAEARRSVLFNVGGLLANEPYAAANINTFFQGTSSSCGLVNRIAAKQFAENQSDGDRGASSRVRTELLERFLSETNEPIAKGKETLANAQSKNRSRANFIPEVYAHTHANKIVVVGKRSSKSTLGAPTYPMQTGIENDIEVRLHDSLLSNYVDPIFSGKTFSNTELAEKLEELTGKKPEALDAEGDQDGPAADESFSITFTNVRPIQFVFEEDTLAVIVSGKEFSQGEKKIDAGLTIKLRFRISRVGEQLLLVRDGNAELDYVDAKNKDAKIVAFRSFLEGRLNPKNKNSPEIELPKNLLPVDTMPALKDRPLVKELQLSQFRIDSGWLYIGWNHVPAGSYNSRPLDLPSIRTEATIQQMDSSYTPVTQN